MSTNVYLKMLKDELNNNSRKVAVDAVTREPIEGDYLEYAGDYDVITIKSYCSQNHSDCNYCSLSNYGRDCYNNPVDNY